MVDLIVDGLRNWPVDVVEHRISEAPIAVSGQLIEVKLNFRANRLRSLTGH